MKFIIHEPIWKNLSIGLAQEKLTQENEIEIDYVDKQGVRPFPLTYSISREKALKYPVVKCKSHWLRVIPISDLSVLGEKVNK